MKRLFVLALLVSCAALSSSAQAQCSGQFPASTVCGSVSGGLAGPITPASVLPSGVNQNILNSQTANYTIATTDCGKTVQAGTGSTGLFTITVPSVSGFAGTCSFLVVNGDTTRGKALTGPGLPGNAPLMLWPQQAIGFAIINGAWAVTQFPGRWKLAAGQTVTFNTDFANGLDTNDGLATGSGNALKTMDGCLSTIINYIDFNGTSNPGKAVCLGSGVGNTDTTTVHESAHAFTGCNGGACVLMDGNTGSYSGSFQLYFGIVIEFRRMNVSATGNCFALHNRYTYFLDGMIFGACSGGAHVALDSLAKAEFENNYSVNGNASYHLFVSEGSVAFYDSLTVSITSPVSITDWIFQASPSYINMQSATFNLGGNVVTGSKGIVELNGVTLQSTATLSVTNAVNGTGNVCRLTVPTGSLAEGQVVNVASVGGATGCNVTAAVHVVDSTHVELAGTTFGGSYTSGGTLQIGVPGTTGISTSLGGQFL